MNDRKKNWWRLSALFLLAVCFLSPSGLVYAGAVQLPATGQQGCWDAGGNVVSCTGTGQDGELRSGQAWPTPRFTAGVATVTDNLTGLVWSKNANLLSTRNPEFDQDGVVGDGMVDWANAVAYLSKLNQDEYLGYSDWRLPNIRELRSLVNYSLGSPASGLADEGFFNLPNGYYWSSTSAALALKQAWAAGVFFGDLTVKGKVNKYLYVWPVRAGLESVGLPETGQRTCWNREGLEISCSSAGYGQDGSVKAGEVWPTPRFLVSPQAVVDSLTNLMWTRNANAPGPAQCAAALSKSWEGALDYIECLNQNRYLGYEDWRLPNINELESLVSYEVNYQTNTSNLLSVAQWLMSGGGFIDVKSSPYWSSSSLASGPGFAWGSNMYAGYLQAYAKADQCYVWPVRDASSVLGDINGDKRVDLADAVLVMQVLTRTWNDGIVSNYPSSGSDLGGNGRIGMEDAIYVIQSAAEIR